MLSEYIDAAMKQAGCEKLESGEFFCSIPGIKGPYGSGASKREALTGLRDVLEEWLVAALRDDDELPAIAGVSLNFGGKRWQDHLPPRPHRQAQRARLHGPFPRQTARIHAKRRLSPPDP